jgi:hypothetical protein
VLVLAKVARQPGLEVSDEVVVVEKRVRAQMGVIKMNRWSNPATYAAAQSF